MSSPLKAVIKHEVRLEILSCLAGGEPLPVAQLSARLERSPGIVSHHIKTLDSFDLVGKAGNDDGGEPLYVARLDEHPDWVAEVVKNHRPY